MTVRVRPNQSGVGVSCRVTSLELHAQVINEEESQRDRIEALTCEEENDERTREDVQELRGLFKGSVEREAKRL